MEERITFVGLDVRKATIAVCLAEAGRDGEVRFADTIPDEPAAALDRLAARLGRGGRTPRLRVRGTARRPATIATALLHHRLGRVGLRCRRARPQAHRRRARRLDAHHLYDCVVEGRLAAG